MIPVHLLMQEDERTLATYADELREQQKKEARRG